MQVCGVMRSCIVLVLVLVMGVASFPQQSLQPSIMGDSTKNIPNFPFPDCPVYVVSDAHPMPKVMLTDEVAAAVLPSSPSLTLNIQLFQNTYEITMNETLVVVTTCALSTKSPCSEEVIGDMSDYEIATNDWNNVAVTFRNHSLNILLDGETVATTDEILSLPSGKTNFDERLFSFVTEGEAETLTVNMYCNETLMPEIPTSSSVPSPSTTTSSSETETTDMTLPEILPAPYHECPLDEVRSDQDEVLRRAFNDSLKMAVFPSDAHLDMRIVLGDHLYKATVDGSMVVLKECALDGSACQMLNEGGSKSKDILMPNQWNNLEITLIDDNVTVTINDMNEVMGMAMPTDSDNKNETLKKEVYFVAVDEYTISINYYCDAEGSPSPQTGSDGPPVGIIVGLLALVLLIIIIAIVVTTMKKRRSADINHHTPLREQGQTK